MDAYGSNAMAQALQSGKPVNVDSMTTETTQVTAEPNGQFQLTSTRGPVRAQTASGWQPIDTTLQTNSDGTFSPKITTIPVSFSGGGNTLLVGIGTSQVGINTYWPTTLPTPTISGNAVTYPNVRPNVDLVLTAQPAGFSETLVIKTPTAAQDVANNPFALTARGQGVTVSQQADGSVTGSDANGNAVFGGPPPTAWDSSINSAEPAVKSNVLQSANALQRPLGMIARPVTGGESFSVSVPQALLSDPSAQYPIYVDPEIGPGQTNWETVENDRTHTSYGKSGSSTQDMRVGYCYWNGCVPMGYDARSFFSFNTSALVGKNTTAHIFTAEVRTLQKYNAMSSATPVNLTRAGAITEGMSYPGPVQATLEQQSSSCGFNGANTCYVSFHGSNVINYLQDDANSGWTGTTFALSAPAEGVRDYWKRFDSASNGEVLTVKYDFPPWGPSNISINNYVDCRPGQPLYIYSSTPTLSAKAYSQDGMDIGMYFEVRNYPSGTLVTDNAHSPAAGATGSQLGWTTSLPDGKYEFRVRAQDISTTQGTTGEYTPWSNYVDFIVRTTGPATPTVSSYSYPQNYWGSSPGVPGTFSFKDSSTLDTAGFSFSIDNAGQEPAVSGCAPYGVTYSTGNGGVVSASGGVGTWTPPVGSLTPGYHVLYVKAFDNAHNPSAESIKYPFYVPRTLSNTTLNNLVEAETLPAVAASTNPVSSTVSPSNDPSYSAGSATKIVTSQSGNSYNFTLNPSSTTSNVPVSGYYALGVQLLKGAQNATLTFAVDGHPATQNVVNPVDGTSTSQPIQQDTCSSTPDTVFVPLGGFQLDATTTHKLTVTMTGSTCGTSGYTAGIDDIVLAPINGATYPSLSMAFNNLGIGTDGTPTTPQASFDGTSADNALSRPALQVADPNFKADGTGTLSPDAYTTFTLPAPTSNGDNTIAMGQTITMTDPKTGNASPAPPPVPNSSTPGYVDFLVGSTCGPVIASSNLNFTLNYADGGKPDHYAPAVPQWTDPIPNNLDTSDAIVKTAITAGHYLTGPSAQTATAPPPAQGVTLYVVKIPWDPNHYNSNLVSVTLPSVGTDFTNTCTTTNNALHVFAITTSTQ